MPPANNTQNIVAPWGQAGETDNSYVSSNIGKFPNPFFDMASYYTPRDLKTVFEMSEFIYSNYGLYRSASRRVVRYFLTEVVLEGEDEESRDEFNEFLNNDLHLMNMLAEIGDDFMCYGNAFISLYFPFDRFLKCQNCGMEYHVDTIAFNFKAKELEFLCECKKCGYKGPFTRLDRRSPDKKQIKIIRWNPKFIRLRYHYISGTSEYFVELLPIFVQKIKEGNRYYLNQTPWEIVKCAVQAAAGQPPLFKFAKNSIYHLKEHTLAGLPIYGWGIPPVLANFKLIYYIQLLRRADEAVALDYIMPMRVIFPQAAPNAQGLDGLNTMSMGVFNNNLQNMIKEHRQQLTDVHSVPFPIGYQAIGGEQKQLTTKELIMASTDELLNSLGYPAELYKGTLSIQAFPVALRLFEKTWGAMVDGFNDMLGWIIQRIAKNYALGDITGTLKSVTLADDIQQAQLRLQAAASGDISKGTAYKNLGIDYLKEMEALLKEQQEIQQMQTDAQKEQQTTAATVSGSGQAGQTGDPMADAGVGATPGDIAEQAKAIAQQLLTQVPEVQRRSELMKIKNTNPTLHAMVKQEMVNLRQQMASQGQQMMLQQAQQQAQGGQGPLGPGQTQAGQ